MIFKPVYGGFKYICILLIRNRGNYALNVQYESKIKRNRDLTVCNVENTKTFRSVYYKLVVVDEYSTVSFGYNRRTLLSDY